MQMYKPVIQYSAKSEHSIRPILLPEPLIQIMKPLRKEKGFLFGGDAPWCYATMNRRVYQGKKLLGIQGFNNHDFRTTYGGFLEIPQGAGRRNPRGKGSPLSPLL